MSACKKGKRRAVRTPYGLGLSLHGERYHCRTSIDKAVKTVQRVVRVEAGGDLSSRGSIRVVDRQSDGL